MKTKYLLTIVFVVVWLWCCSWLFNHFNPWVAIIGGPAVLFLTIKLTIKQLEKDEKSQKKRAQTNNN